MWARVSNKKYQYQPISHVCKDSCFGMDVIVFSSQQCGEEFLMKNININQSVMFARILVLEWMLLFSPFNVSKSF